jgi:hypothetical protein
MNAEIKRSVCLFLISGSIGVAVALGLYVLGAFSYTRPFVAYAAPILCPEMVLGLAEPTSFGAMILLLSFVFITNFLTYGLIGTVVYLTWLLLRRTSSTN